MTTYFTEGRTKRRARLVCDRVLIAFRTIAITGKDNNTKDLRVRHLDYASQFCEFFDVVGTTSQSRTLGVLTIRRRRAESLYTNW